MIGRKQEQGVGEGAIAMQAGGDMTVVHVGLQYSEVKAVALDVARSVYQELRGEAIVEARKRAEEVTDSLLGKLSAEFPEGLQKANDPDFQYNLLVMQREYARHGDKDLGELLVDLMVERTRQGARSLRQIVLGESLTTAATLTTDQFAILSLVFLFRYTRNQSIGSVEAFGDYLDRHVQPFLENLSVTGTTFQHLEFARCGSQQVTSLSIPQILIQSYPGLFSKGFTKGELDAKVFSNANAIQKVIMLCMHDRARFQVAALNSDQLRSVMQSDGFPQADIDKAVELLSANLMNEGEIEEKVVEARPYMESLMQQWRETPLASFTLTSVGIAIGHAGVRRVIGNEWADLSIWIK